MSRKIRTLCAVLAAAFSVSMLPCGGYAAATATEMCEVTRVDFDEKNVFTGSAGGFNWQVQGAYPVAENGFALFGNGSNGKDCVANLPEAYSGSVRVEMRVKNLVDASSAKKGAAIYFRNSGQDILRAQIKNDGWLYLQGGTGEGSGRKEIKIADTANGDFYKLTVDFDFEAQSVSASVMNDNDDELATAECKGLAFYKNNKSNQINSILFSKNNFDGTLYADYISVSKQMSDKEIAQLVLNGIEIENADDITADFSLPKSGKNGAVIEWISDNPQIEIVDGADSYTARVTRPEGSSVSGGLKCSVTKGDETLNKTFDATVTLVITDEVKAKRDLEAIKLDTKYVTEDITLPTVGGVYASDISWELEESDYAELDGSKVKITRPDSSKGSVNVKLTACANQNAATGRRDFSLRIIKQSSAIIEDIYDECGFAESKVNGYASVKKSGLGYPKIEKDDILDKDCLVFASDSAKSEAYRVVTDYSAQRVKIKAKLRVDAVEGKGVNFYLQDSNSKNIARVNVQSGVMKLTYGAGDGVNKENSPLVSATEADRFYELELTVDCANRTVSAAVDSKAIIANVPFIDVAGAPAKILIGTNADSTAKLKLAELYMYADAPELDDEEACAADAGAIDFKADDSVTEDFTVPTAGDNGTVIEWSSSNTSVISIINGKVTVTRPDAAAGDTDVILTATVKRGVSTAKKAYTVRVMSVSDEEAVEKALAKVSIEEREGITDDITLPKNGAYGVSFSWSSSDDRILSDDGEVSRSKLTQDRQVTLTLTATKNGTSQTKKFTVTVKAGKSGSSGGGSGSSSGGVSTSVTVSNDVGVTVTPAPVDNGSFNDIAGYEWAAESIRVFSKAGYISGIGNGSFEPGRNVTREEFVTVLVKALGIYDASAECDFDDLRKEHWSYRYVASAVKAGVVSGIDEKTFGTGRNITRQDMCVMLLRGMNAIGYTVLAKGDKTFADFGAISGYASSAVAKLASAEVVSGMEADKFMPMETATRAQMVRVIYAATEAKVAGSDDLSTPAPTNGSVLNVDVELSYNGQAQSREPYAGADQTAVAAYNAVADRKAKAMDIYYKAPSVTLNTGAWSDAAYAAAALWANDTDAGNECVIRICTENPPSGGTQSSDSYFCMNLLMRCWFTFSDKSTIYPGRLSAEAQAAIEKYFFDYLQLNTDLSTAKEMHEDKIYIQDSENHDIVQRSAFFIGAELLLQSDTYKNRSIGTASLEEFRDAWGKYLKYYFNMKARYGLTVETGSPTYSKYTVDSMYSIYDFTSDRELKALVGKYLDVYYADAVLETLNGVRAGSRNRNYQDKYSWTPAMDAINFYTYIQFGTGEHLYSEYSAHPAQLSAAMTDYVAPFVLFDISYNKTENGGITYESQTMAAGTRGTVGEYNSLNYEMTLPGSVYRKTYINDAYSISSQTIDRNLTYAQIHTQNKWMGVVFNGGMRTRFDSRVFVQGLGTAQSGRTGYNEINGICTDSALLVEGLPEAVDSSGIKIYISQDIYDSKIIEDGWLFGDDTDGSCYVAIKPSRGEFQSFEEGTGGTVAKVSNSYAPVVIQVAEKKDYESMDEFMKAVSECTFSWNGNLFTYCDLTGNTVEMSAEKILPKLNSEEINVQPEYLVRSPYFNSRYASGVFDIVDTKGQKFVVDFN